VPSLTEIIEGSIRDRRRDCESMRWRRWWYQVWWYIFRKKVAGGCCGPGYSDGGPVVVKKKIRKKQKEDSYERIEWIQFSGSHWHVQVLEYIDLDGSFPTPVPTLKSSCHWELKSLYISMLAPWRIIFTTGSPFSLQYGSGLARSILAFLDDLIHLLSASIPVSPLPYKHKLGLQAFTSSISIRTYETSCSMIFSGIEMMYTAWLVTGQATDVNWSPFHIVCQPRWLTELNHLGHCYAPGLQNLLMLTILVIIIVTVSSKEHGINRPETSWQVQCSTNP
jgi:hypothetical protein